MLDLTERQRADGRGQSGPILSGVSLSLCILAREGLESLSTIGALSLAAVTVICTNGVKSVVGNTNINIVIENDEISNEGKGNDEKR